MLNNKKTEAESLRIFVGPSSSSKSSFFYGHWRHDRTIVYLLINDNTHALRTFWKRFMAFLPWFLDESSNIVGCTMLASFEQYVGWRWLEFYASLKFSSNIVQHCWLNNVRT
jgi:hypothetical protein